MVSIAQGWTRPMQQLPRHARPKKQRPRVRPIERWAGGDVTALRRRLRLTQGSLAAMLGWDVRTVANWERGYRAPNQAQCRTLDLIAAHPEWFAEGW